MKTSHLPKLPGIYRIVHTPSGREYIGSAVSLKDRAWNHKYYLSIGRHHSRHLQRAYSKYGQDQFSFEVIEIVPLVGLLIEKEQHYIDLRNPDFNICRVAGSHLGCVRTSQTRRRIKESLLKIRHHLSQAKLGKKKSIETRRRMSAAQIGNKKALGKKATPEARANMRRAQSGKMFSAETRAKISASLTGRKSTRGFYRHSPGTIEKMSAAHKGVRWTDKQRNARLKLVNKRNKENEMVQLKTV